MQIMIRPSDLYHRYRRKKGRRAFPKFAGKPDPAPFDRDDLYEVIPLLEAVMNELGSCDARVLHRLEEMIHYEVPACVATREEMFDCLVGAMRELLEG